MADETPQARCLNPLEKAEKLAAAHLGTSQAHLPSQASGCRGAVGTRLGVILDLGSGDQ